MSDQPAPPSPGPTPPDDLEELLSQALERLDAEGQQGVDSFLAAHPLAAPQLRAHLERLDRAGMTASPKPGDAPPHPERLGDFRLLDPLGQGGMGVVFRAVQESLGREVAIKLIRPDQMFFPGARERFRREVELVARMQHPGIVPVYAVGTEGGVPYFAMELVRGATLADVIEKLAGRDPKDLDGGDLDRCVAQVLGDTADREPAELFRGDWTKVVLRIVREVADALEHAHRRGVLHRDVKPSNIMVTRDGRVLLLDFGLAGADNAERLTRTGSALGSLAYMPPELLTGEPVERDARCDVYSLGASCWELLSLRLPYQSSDPVKLRKMATAAERPKLSTLLPSISWDVETVIATALDPERERRYASASLFSRDLDNLLAHRPIEARDPGVLLRTRRWTQRHPARATAALAFAIALIGGPSLWAWMESRTRVRIEAQRDELVKTNAALDKANARATVETQRAHLNFAKLQEAVDTMLTKVGDESLRDIPRMEIVRRELLNEALHFYEGFLADQPDDPELHLEAGRVRLRMADVHALLGNYAAAREDVERALALIAGQSVTDPEFGSELARAHYRLGSARRLLGDLPGARTAADEAIRSWRTLCSGPIEKVSAKTAIGLASARLESCLIAVDAGDLAGGIATLDESEREIDAWQKAHPADSSLRQVRARTLDRAAISLAQLAMQSRDRAAGMEKLEKVLTLHGRARQLWDELLTSRPNDAQIKSDAAQNAINASLPLQMMGRAGEARELLERGITFLQALVVDFPASQRRRSELASARANYASLLGQAEDNAGSLRESNASLELWQGLVKESPDNDEYSIGLCQALQGKALGLWYTGTPAKDVLPLVVAAAAAGAHALQARPDNPTYRRVCRKMAETEAELCIEIPDHARAASAARRLLDEATAPVEPFLAGALLARAAPLALADEGLTADARKQIAADYRAQAKTLLEGVLAKGIAPGALHANPAFSGQWDKPGFAELWRELTANHR